MVTKIERINLINGLSTKLITLEPVLASVVMKEHGWTRHGFLDWNEDENSYLVAEFLMLCSDQTLLDINNYFLSTGSQSSSLAESVEENLDENRFYLFLSHKSEHKNIAVDLKNNLIQEGIHAFVAHQDIDDNALWREAIKKELARSHAFVIILTEGIDSSVWCQQEAGWAMARQIPTIAVNFIENPPSFGFLSDYQYIQYGLNDMKNIAERISTALLDHESTRGIMRGKKLQLLRESWSFERTRTIWRSVESLGQLTSLELDIVKEAFKNNPQVRECSIDRREAGKGIAEFIERQSQGLVAIDS